MNFRKNWWNLWKSRKFT